MSQNTTNFILPYLAEGQAQKHVTVNETIRKLDAIVQITVESATTAAEPGAPSDGQTWIVPAGKTGTSWAAFTNNAIGYYRDGAWEQITPREGWLAWVRDDEELVVYNGTDWDVVTSGTLGTAAAEDIGTSGANVPLLNGSNVWAEGQTLRNSAGGLILQKTDGTLVSIFGIRSDITGSDTAILLWNSGIAGDFIVSMSARPLIDNNYSLGNASFRWSTVYAATGTINTSDAGEKTDLRPLTDAEIRAVRRVMGQLGVFQWREAIARKGHDPAEGGARLHCGATAQAVKAAFAAEGLDAAHYGLFCADPLVETVELAPARVEVVKTKNERDAVVEERREIPARTETRPIIDAGTGEQLVRLGVRYDQLFAMAIGALSRAAGTFG